MPRRRRLPIIKNGKALLKMDIHHRRTTLRFFLGYMPVCYNRLTEPGIWAEVPAEWALEIVDQIGGLKTSFWHTDLRAIENWNDDPEQIERWNNASEPENRNVSGQDTEARPQAEIIALDSTERASETCQTEGIAETLDG